MKRVVYYIVASSVAAAAVQFAGGTMGQGFLAGLLVPPLLLLALMLWRFRGIGRRIEHEYWTGRHRGTNR